MYLDTDKVLFRRRGGHLQGRMPHAKTDFQGTWRLTTKYLVEIPRAVSQFQAEQGPTLIQPALLAFGHAPGAHDETLDGAAELRRLVLGRWALVSRRRPVTRKRHVTAGPRLVAVGLLALRGHERPVPVRRRVRVGRATGCWACSAAWLEHSVQRRRRARLALFGRAAGNPAQVTVFDGVVRGKGHPHWR